MNCSNCGNPVREGDIFCMNCGFKLADAAAPVENIPVAPVAEAPAVPAFDAPAAPAFDAPASETPSFEAPATVEEALPEPPPFQPSPLQVDDVPSPLQVDDVPSPLQVDDVPSPLQVDDVPAPAGESIAPVAAVAAAPVAAATAAFTSDEVLPEPPPFQPSQPMQQEVAEGVSSTPINAESAYPNQFAGGGAGPASEPGAIPQAPGEAAKKAADELFTRKEWKDSSVNNGGIVNQGPKKF